MEINELKEYALVLKEELAGFENIDSELVKKSGESAVLAENLKEDAISLSEARREATGVLRGEVLKQFADLNFKSSDFEIKNEFLPAGNGNAGIEIDGNRIKVGANGIDNIELLEDSANFCEQASLSLALAATHTQFEVFGNDMNFPTHFNSYMTPLGETDPLIIHYHSLVNPSGYIDPSLYALANNRITQFNEMLHKERS